MVSKPGGDIVHVIEKSDQGHPHAQNNDVKYIIVLYILLYLGTDQKPHKGLNSGRGTHKRPQMGRYTHPRDSTEKRVTQWTRETHTPTAGT